MPGTQCHVPSPRGASQPGSSRPRIYSYSHSWGPHSEGWGLATLAQEVPSSFLGPGGLSAFPSPSPTGPCPEQSPSASLSAQPYLWGLAEAHLPAFPELPFSLEVRGLLGAVPSVCTPPPLTGPEGNFPVTHSAGTSCGHQGRGWGDPVGWLCVLGSLGEGDCVSRPLKGCDSLKQAADHIWETYFS